MIETGRERECERERGGERESGCVRERQGEKESERDIPSEAVVWYCDCNFQIN